ncbi:Major facilitator superfamily domain, general substrate transporter [Niveomyces insectorum RCEF 264]|uniref:Major facilitator superfamily domain, general substrate transporter n=1 Tax=Niveomyces insectorum RCEF 264 TaxID=1081102 RepID=A0A167N9L2_9HYPO|nr:Major facilitator superfamily domain, general substrate transporter [Niveomyces insectorum RCEF 264]
MANISNGVLYGVFVFSALLAGTVLNTLGPRLTMIFGITGYPVYIGAMWYFDQEGHLWYPIFAGAYLGLTAGCLWSTAAYTCNAYAEEKQKGMWRAMQWTGNVSGSAIGACVALGVSWNSSSASVPHTVYIIFIVIQCLSVGFAMLLKPSHALRRSDGTALATFEQLSAWQSLKITGALFKDWRILILIPACFTGEMFFPFQASMNAYAFNLRTRTLNSLLNNLIQIPVTMGMGVLLDSARFGNRKRRAYLGITFDAVWITGAYIAQTIWLSSWKFDRSVPGPSIDCTDPAYAGAVVIYMLYAAQYGVFQNVVLYVLGSLTNEPRKLAAIGGFLVSWLSAGTAVSFGVDATVQPYENENAGYFALTTICWPILYFVAWKCVNDTNYDKEENVIVPLHVRKEMHLEGVEVANEGTQNEIVEKRE